MAAVWRALVAMLLIQAIVVLAAQQMPVLAPIVAPDLQVNPDLVGYFAALANAGAILAALAASRAVRRYGAMRVSQFMLCLAAFGLGLLATGALPALLPAALALGAGYGLANPASSHLLAKLTPEAMRGRVFSMKQTSVPLGVAGAGLMSPWLASAYGWQNTMLGLAAVALLMALAFQPWRSDMDDDRQGRSVAKSSLIAPLLFVIRTPAILRLCLLSMAYSAAQFCFTAGYVTVLVESMAIDPLAAGRTLAFALIASMFARVGWGWCADKIGAAETMAIISGFIIAAAFAAALLDPSFGIAGATAIAILFGASAASWNGVYLASVATAAPKDSVSLATSGAMALTLSGAIIGPAAFALLAATTGGYEAGFFFVAILAAVSAVGFLIESRRQ
jgi:MFS family permease